MPIKVRKGQKVYEGLYDLNEKPYDKPLYKYMDMGAAIKCIKDGSLRFVEPSCWKDQFEKLFYMAAYKNIAKDANPLLYANCFTKEQMSEAAWELYTYHGNGIGANCVQFSIDVKKLREELADNAKSHSNWCLYEGDVNYEYNAEDLIRLHLKNDKYKVRSELFSKDFSVDNFLTLLLLKRRMFEHEHEYRFFLIDEDTKSHKKGQLLKGGYRGEAKDVKIDWTKIVTKISINKACSDIDYKIFVDFAERNGFNRKDIEKIDIYKKPRRRLSIDIG